VYVVLLDLLSLSADRASIASIYVGPLDIYADKSKWTNFALSKTRLRRDINKIKGGSEENLRLNLKIEETYKRLITAALCIT